MGTRNLTGVRLNGEWKVAQYGQWDGYPSGQGITVLDFLNGVNLDAFREKVAQCIFLTDDQLKAVYAKYTNEHGWMTMEQSAAFDKSKYGYLSRDTGAKILDIIANSEEPIKLSDVSEFLNDGSFCEWAYVIDLDRNVLQVYKGFGKSPETNPNSVTMDSTGHKPDSKSDSKSHEMYYVNLKKEYSLAALPTEDQFINDLEKSYEDESEEALTSDV